MPDQARALAEDNWVLRADNTTLAWKGAGKHASSQMGAVA